MSKHLRTLMVGAAAVALAAMPALDTQADPRMPQGSMMGQGMMGGMMSGMMARCSEMMQAMHDGHAHRPNEQWRAPQPQQPAQPRG